MFPSPRPLTLTAMAVLLAFLQYRLWLGEGGIADLRRHQAEVATQQEEVARLKARNDALAAEVVDLKSGKAAIEARARADLGMIFPGETFYVITPRT